MGVTCRIQVKKQTQYLQTFSHPTILTSDELPLLPPELPAGATGDQQLSGVLQELEYIQGGAHPLDGEPGLAADWQSRLGAHGRLFFSFL